MSIKKNPILSVIIRVSPRFPTGSPQQPAVTFHHAKNGSDAENILKIPLDLNSERFSVIVLGSVMCGGSLAVLLS